jgi:hypothetical protein
LRGASWVEGAAAIAQAEVQAAVWAEGKVASVVILLGLIERQQPTERSSADPPAARIGAELLDARVSAPVAVVDVEEAVAGEVGVERHAEQALFGAGPDSARQIQRDRPATALLAQQSARLLGDPAAARIARRDTRPRRSVQSMGDAAHIERVRRSALRGRRRRGFAGGGLGRRGGGARRAAGRGEQADGDQRGRVPETHEHGRAS